MTQALSIPPGRVPPNRSFGPPSAVILGPAKVQRLVREESGLHSTPEVVSRGSKLIIDEILKPLRPRLTAARGVKSQGSNVVKSGNLGGGLRREIRMGGARELRKRQIVGVAFVDVVVRVVRVVIACPFYTLREWMRGQGDVIAS